MRFNYMAFATAFAAGCAVGCAAHADQITFENSVGGSYVFTGTPPSGLTWASPAGLDGAAQSNSGMGTYGLGSFPTTPIDPISGATNVTQSLTVVLSNADTLSGTVAWNQVNGQSNFTDVSGTLAVTTSGGDANWLASWSQGTTATIDMVLTGVVFPLSDLVEQGGIENLTISSGGTAIPTSGGPVVPPQLTPAPEPRSVSTLGTALLVVSLLLLRRRSAQRMRLRPRFGSAEC